MERYMLHRQKQQLQESLDSMVVWYRYSALTIVYLSDVLPSSKSGALAKSEWNRRGWTFQEYSFSFTRGTGPYISTTALPNHKDSAAIMEESHDATGIDRQALAVFRPGMSNTRERFQWASLRITTLQEDVAYSLFGIFSVYLPIIHGEKKQNALGQATLLPSTGSDNPPSSIAVFQPTLPPYAALPFTMPSLSEDEIRTTVSSLRNIVAAEPAPKFYTLLDNMGAPRFAHCRLYVPCMVFRVTEVGRRRDLAIKHASNVTLS